ncbi:MAG: hypothetical protein JXB48_14160 [Candidatus Latescibacteria bacterium]|nr:hypothetical protein [Candidatus Latescibacterota bacterium]
MKTKPFMVLGAILLAVLGFIIYPIIYFKKNKSKFKIFTQFKKEGANQ